MSGQISLSGLLFHGFYAETQQTKIRSRVGNEKRRWVKKGLEMLFLKMSALKTEIQKRILALFF